MQQSSVSTCLRGRFSRAALFLSVSALCLGSVAAPVQAQTLDNSLFVSAYGGYLFNDSGTNFDFDNEDDKLGGLASLDPGRDGHQIGGAVGVPLSERTDFRAAFTSESFRRDRDSVSDYSEPGSFAEADSRFSMQYLDLELGYRPGVIGNGHIRLFAGPRILHAENHVDYSYFEPEPDKIGDYEAGTEVWGIGPRLGAEGGVQLGNSGVSLFIMGAGSAIFSDVERRYDYFEDDGIGSGDERDGDFRTIYSLEGKVALGYDVTRSVNLQIGYQAQQWWNLIDRVDDVDNSDTSLDFAGDGDFLTHGPFARITVKLP